MEDRHTPALKKLSDVVKSFLNVAGEFTKDNYVRYLQIVIEGLTDLNIYHTVAVKTVIKRVNDANMIALEPDFIDWASISVVIGGVVYPIGFNDDIALPADQLCVYDPSIPEHLNNLDYSHYQDYSSSGGKRFAEFKVFKKERKIQFRGSIKNYDVLIEYVSSGVNLETDTLVPIELVPVLKTYLRWQLLEFDDRAPLNAKFRAEQQYGNELVKMISAQNAMSASEFIDIIRSGYKQTVKR